MGLIKIDELRECTTTKEAINKMFEMCYTTTELLDKDPSCDEKQMYPARVESFMGNRYKTFGFYMKHKKIDINNKSTSFDSYFKACENIYYKLFNTDIEKYDIEEHLQDARLTALEVIYDYYDRCTTVESSIDISTVDKFCNMLEDKEKCAMLYSYLLRIVKSTAYKSLYSEGRKTSSNRDYYLKRVQKDNVRKTKRVNLRYVFLDSYTTENDEDLTKYNILDIHNQKEGNEIDVEGIVFNAIESKNGTLKYILDNKDKIFTKKQLDKLELLLNDRKEFGDIHNRKKYERNFVKKAFEKLENDKFCYIENEQLRLKNIDFLVAIESIINASTSLEQFDIIKNILMNKKDFTNTLFIELIYSLDESIIRDLVYCLTEEVDESWLESDDFQEIIHKLIDEYNYQIKNARMIYKCNKEKRVSKEDKIKNYIEKNCFIVEGHEFGYISKSSEGSDSIPNLQEVTDFVNKVYNENFEKKHIRPFLKKLGYDVDVSKRTVKNKIPCYKIFRFED